MFIQQKRKIDYPKILDAAWQEHLKQKQSDAPTVISLFAGCGGSSLGYSMAGFRELLAVEWDDHACQVFGENFSGIKLYQKDITDLSVDECLSLAAVKAGELDVLDGSPPCQGFSMTGKREFGDDRNDLFKQYIRILSGLKPKVFVMENVSGMIKGVMKIKFVEILKELKSCGYNVQCKVLNAKYFNVPQSRERVIFIGVRDDLNLKPSFPEIESIEINVREAFNGVKNDDCNSREIKDNWLKKAVNEINSINEGKRNADRIFKKYKGNDNGSRNFSILNWDTPSCTIPKSEIGVSGILHPDRTRYCSILELKRISSFPDQFEFFGSRREIHARLGNCVPPLFMKAIARNIRINILEKAGK